MSHNPELQSSDAFVDGDGFLADPPVPGEGRPDLPPPATREAIRSRRKREVRAQTLSVKRLTKREIDLGRLLVSQAELDEVEALRPKTRADCQGHRGPCPFVSCEHHLFLDVSPRTGAIKFNFPDLEVEDLRETCALDVSDRGGATLEEVGAIMNLTRERIRQVAARALAHADISSLGDYAYAGAEGRKRRRLPLVEDGEDAPDASAGEDGDLPVLVRRGPHRCEDSVAARVADHVEKHPEGASIQDCVDVLGLPYRKVSAALHHSVHIGRAERRGPKGSSVFFPPGAPPAPPPSAIATPKTITSGLSPEDFFAATVHSAIEMPDPTLEVTATDDLPVHLQPAHGQSVVIAWISEEAATDLASLAKLRGSTVSATFEWLIAQYGSRELRPQEET